MKKYIIQDLRSYDYLSLFPSFSMVKEVGKATAFSSEEVAISKAGAAGLEFFSIITVFTF